MSDYADLPTMHSGLRLCRRCAEAGCQIESGPVFSGEKSARVMLIGQAPGVTEGASGLPFSGDSGHRLFRWLAQAGWDEATFRADSYITSVTKCFPGRAASGNGDRVPSVSEQKLCRDWLELELHFVQPKLIIPVGLLAIRLFYHPDVRLEDIVGKSMTDGAGRHIVPLPHPSGASRWHNDPRNVGRIQQAIYTLALLRDRMGA